MTQCSRRPFAATADWLSRTATRTRPPAWQAGKTVVSGGRGRSESSIHGVWIEEAGPPFVRVGVRDLTQTWPAISGLTRGRQLLARRDWWRAARRESAVLPSRRSRTRRLEAVLRGRVPPGKSDGAPWHTPGWRGPSAGRARARWSRRPRSGPLRWMRRRGSLSGARASSGYMRLVVLGEARASRIRPGRAR